MERITFNLFNRLLIITGLIIVFSCSAEQNEGFSERTKIALRDVGNKLLLSNKDSTSLILPVIRLDNGKYQTAFSESLAIEPSNLVSILEGSFKTSQLPEHYRVEVIQCSDREVAYSYAMSAQEESTIIPCSGRYLPKACYIIEVEFISVVKLRSIKSVIIKTSITLALLTLVFFLKVKGTKHKKAKLENDASEKLGSFYFYPEQNKLVKEAEEIALSKKECELLALFVASPNQIIKRDELTKRVWEDNGVFVGRSLDTYISKLRKKLKSDTSIKLTNVHGIGYKLEIK